MSAFFEVSFIEFLATHSRIFVLDNKYTMLQKPGKQIKVDQVEDPVQITVSNTGENIPVFLYQPLML